MRAPALGRKRGVRASQRVFELASLRACERCKEGACELQHLSESEACARRSASSSLRALRSGSMRAPVLEPVGDFRCRAADLRSCLSHGKCERHACTHGAASCQAGQRTSTAVAGGVVRAEPPLATHPARAARAKECGHCSCYAFPYENTGLRGPPRCLYFSIHKA